MCPSRPQRPQEHAHALEAGHQALGLGRRRGLHGLGPVRQRGLHRGGQRGSAHALAGIHARDPKGSAVLRRTHAIDVAVVRVGDLIAAAAKARRKDAGDRHAHAAAVEGVDRLDGHTGRPSALSRKPRSNQQVSICCLPGADGIYRCVLAQHRAQPVCWNVPSVERGNRGWLPTHHRQEGHVRNVGHAVQRLHRGDMAQWQRSALALCHHHDGLALAVGGTLGDGRGDGREHQP